MSVSTTPRARADIADIGVHIATEGGVDASDRFIDELDDRLALYATHPRMGRPRPELGPGLRSFPLGRDVVFHRRLHTSRIDVVRVLWRARDILPLFEP